MNYYNILILLTISVFLCGVDSQQSIPCTNDVVAVETIATNILGIRTNNDTRTLTKVSGMLQPGEALCFEISQVRDGAYDQDFNLTRPAKFVVEFNNIYLKYRIFDKRPVCKDLDVTHRCICDCMGAQDGDVCSAHGKGFTPVSDATNEHVGYHERATSKGCYIGSYSNMCCELTLSCVKDGAEVFDVADSFETYGEFTVRKTASDGQESVLHIVGNLGTSFRKSVGESSAMKFTHNGKFVFDYYPGGDRVYTNNQAHYVVDKTKWNGMHDFDVRRGDWYKPWINSYSLRYDPNDLLNNYRCTASYCSYDKIQCARSVVSNRLNGDELSLQQRIMPFGQHLEITPSFIMYSPSRNSKSHISLEIVESGTILFFESEPSAGKLVCTGMDNLDGLSYINCYVGDIVHGGSATVSVAIHPESGGSATEYVFDIVLPAAAQYNFTAQVVYGGNETIRVCLHTSNPVDLCSELYLVQRKEKGWNPFTVVDSGDGDPGPTDDASSSGLLWILSYLSWLNPAAWFSGVLSWWQSILGVVSDAFIIVVLFIVVRKFVYPCIMKRKSRKHMAVVSRGMISRDNDVELVQL